MVAAGRQPGLPKTLYLETTNRCNLRCKGCIQYHGHWEPRRDLSLEEFRMITGQLPDLERAVLHGIGEPLLNKALPEMIRRLKKRRVHVLFNSNGILLDARRRDELMEAGLDELRVSLDAATPEGYRAVRNSDAFDRIVDNLRRFSETLALRRAKFPKLSLWFLASRENISELSGLIELAASIGVQEVYLQRLVYFQDNDGFGLARRKNSMMGGEKGLIDIIEKSQELAARLGVSCRASGRTTPFASLRGLDPGPAPWRQCYRPETLTYITANGNVLPCCISPFATSDYQAIVLGNVFTEPLGDIWHGSRYQNFRQLRLTATPPVSCRGCGISWSL
jgi:radical SAM protein with 4Fe4S-binding SPASM domain